MPMPLLIPILLLALGALLLPLLGAVPRMRGLGFIAVAIAGLALAALWQLGDKLPIEWVATSWHPLALFGAPLTFEVKFGSWVFAMALVAISTLSLAACCASEDRPPTAHVALILGATGTGVVALFATSFVALVAAWGATDVLLAGAMLRYGREGARRAGLALFSGVVATSALWAAPLLAQTEGISGFINLAQFTGHSATLLQIAVILRLGLVPFHVSRPFDLNTQTAQLIPVVVIPTLLGFDLLTYVPALTAGLPSVLFALAAVTLLAGGFVAWSETEERASFAGVMVAQTGLAVLAVANAGQQAVATAVASAVSWTLGITVFALTPGWSGRRFWRGIPSLIALVSLLGLPATLGFITRFTAYSGLEAALLALAVALLGEAFVVAALARMWFWAEPRPLPKRRLLEPGYLMIFTAAASVLILTGLKPETFTGRSQDATLLKLDALIGQGGVAGWAGWALPLVAGVTLFLAGEGLRQRLEGSWQGLGALLRLEWIYGLVFLALRWIVGVMRGMSTIVEGEGALLWTTVILLLILLYLLGNGGALAGP